MKRTTKYLIAHGIDQVIAEKYMLGYVNPATREDARYAGRLSIPYITSSGVKAFKFRCVEHDDCKAAGCNKYLAPDEQANWIFNPLAFLIADEVIGITEGEINAIVASERIGVPTTGIPGTEAWRPNRRQWKLAFQDYDKVLVFTDEKDGPSERHPEGAGIDLAQMIAHDLAPRSRLVRCAPGHDVSSMVAAGRAAELRRKAGL